VRPGHDQPQAFALTGQIVSPHTTSAVLAGYRVEAWSGERLIAATTTDAFGRFVLQGQTAEERPSFVSVRAFAPWKHAAGEIRLSLSEVLSPQALTFSAVPEPASVSQRIEPPRLRLASETVSEKDLALFLSAVSGAVAEDYLLSDEAAWVQRSIADLDGAAAVAREAVLGDLRSLGVLRTMLRAEPRFEIPVRPRGGLAGRRPAFGGMRDCFVSPLDPIPMIWGPVMLDGLKGGFGWSERALGFFNARAMPVDVVFNAAADWAGGALGSADFARVVKAFDPGRFGQPAGPLPPGFPDLGSCLSERDVCIGAFLFDLQQYGSQSVADPPDVGSIVPDAICAGSGGNLTLLPPAGSQFPATAPTEWSLAIDGKAIAIQSWDPAEVVISFPANVNPGCQPIRWVHALDPEFVNHLREIGSQCAPFFGGATGWAKMPLTIGETAIEISVVGTPRIRRFTAAGLTMLVAEGCTAVKLEWEADVALCAGSTAYLDVSLLKDGSLYASALAATGDSMVSDDATATYTLRVEAYDGVNRCSFVEESVQVQRYQALHASAPPDNCVDAGGTLPVSVMISCPAPPGGLPVMLTSSNLARLTSGSVTIPEGGIEEFLDLPIGLECGEATITVTAPGHQSTSFTRLVSDYPQITAITPAAVNACDPFQVWLDGSCLGDRLGQLSALLTSGSGSQVVGQILQLQGGTRLLVEFPGIAPGQYPLSVTFCGKTGSANSLLVVNEKPVTIPRFVATPSSIVLCPVSITLSWRVDAARRVHILRDGVVLPGSERIRNDDCGLWEETFDDPQVQANTVEYTLEAFPTSGSPVRTAQTTVSAARKIFLSLAQQGSSTSAIYNNTAQDPLGLCQTKHAVVTNVKNISSRNLSLAHGGAGASFIVIPAGGTTSAFNGALVEGNWTAQVGGATASLPGQVTFAIDWKVP